ncbi:MAG TPA: class II poly(R)-hydroxyalkanoic acid synthase, partial [Hellea balneolensis]|nr:class II poly(R)-hydroxyalkanoic acid synthase [Hellea balneolensis]
MAKQVDNLEKKAAETPTSINTLIGVRRGELIKSLGVLVGHAVKQPKPLAKNLANYGKEIVKIAKGE